MGAPGATGSAQSGESERILLVSESGELGGPNTTYTSGGEGSPQSVRATPAEVQQLQAGKARLSKEEFNAQVAGGVMISFLLDQEQNLSKLRQSIYDAAIVMPQVARSAGWPWSLTLLSIRSIFFLLANFGLQLFILYMLVQEEEVMDRFAGQMNLCDFGARIQNCPDGPNCIGPGGTNYESAARMYGYDVWSTRVFIRDSLKALFPDKAHVIDSTVDVGEYGLENYWVRFVCVFIFMMSVMSDLRSTMDMVSILWNVPTKPGMWLEYRVPSWASKEKIKEVHGMSELDFVKFKIDGMPLRWKLFNLAAIIVPKLWIWRTTAKNGVMFLMETAGIENVIVNVTALTFILNLDEMIFENFSHSVLHHILGSLEPLDNDPDADQTEAQTTDDAFLHLQRDRRLGSSHWLLFPYRVFLNLIFSGLFIAEYYFWHCEQSETGGMVSRAMSLPTEQVYPWLSFALDPFLREGQLEESYWQMPA